MKTYFKNSAYLVLFTLLLCTCIATLGIPFFIFAWFNGNSPFDMLHNYFFYTHMPKIKAVTNGYEVVILVKQPFKFWREAYNTEFYYDMSKGLRQYTSKTTLQEIAIEKIGMVKKHFERRKFEEMQLINEMDVYKAMTEVDDES